MSAFSRAMDSRVLEIPLAVGIPLATINLFSTRSATPQRMFADGILLDVLVLLTLVCGTHDASLVAEEG